MYLKHTTRRNNYRLMVPSDNDKNFYSISYESLLTSCTTADVVEIDFPYTYSSRWIKLLGSCNGLVCFWYYPMQSYFVWNPAIEEYKRLPKSQSYHIDNVGISSYGFGYDYKNDDYKLATIVSHKTSCFVYVYSLKSNSWKNFRSVYCELYDNQESGLVHFNGAIHWLGQRIGESSSRMIVSMDIDEERFEELQLPPTQYYMNMGVLEGCLCVLAHIQETAFEVWVMQDYGVPESWTRLYTITYESIMCASRPRFSGPVELLGSFKTGEIVFRIMESVILYDPKCGTAKTPINTRGLKVGRALSYFESLVSLNSIYQCCGDKEKDWKLDTRVLL